MHEPMERIYNRTPSELCFTTWISDSLRYYLNKIVSTFYPSVYNRSARRNVTELTTTVPSVAESPLFILPAELRLHIYEYALYNGSDGTCEVTREHGIPEPALLLTCKIIREEAISIFYALNTFRTIMEACHPAVLVMMERKWACLKAAGVELGTVRVESAVSGRYCFGNLVLWLEYVHRSEGEVSITPPADGTKDPMQKFLEGLFGVAVGMKGRPWSEVEKIIYDLRGGLIALHKGWEDDS